VSATGRGLEALALLALLGLVAGAGAWLHGDALGEAWRSAEMPGAGRLALAGGAVAAWLALLWVTRTRGAVSAADTDADLVIAVASQTGTGDGLAREAEAALAGMGVRARRIPLGTLEPSALRAGTPLLVIAATCGEGDAPDEAAGFLARPPVRAGALAHLRIGVLALGDRRYEGFCAFGRRVRAWAEAGGAAALHAPIEVDDGDPVALAAWRAEVGAIAQALRTTAADAAAARRMPATAESASAGAAVDIAAPPALAWSSAPWDDWPLLARRLLNPGSQGGELHEIRLVPPPGARWQAGDLLEVLPPGDDRPRAYSIASVPGEGALRLLVRRHVRADGTPGACSEALCAGAPVGDALRARLRPHPGFHAPDGAPPLLLIGNGSGLAGLRAHIAAREHAGLGTVWLLHGERQAAHDALLDDELRDWLAAGVIVRLDRVYSRDPDGGGYVQDALRREAGAVRAWVARGAVVMVCGSARGMAPGVDAALRDALGDGGLAALAAAGRYRRDVY
jgi:sulfite reductase (NADPH) flavoprotein alpha-component